VAKVAAVAIVTVGHSHLGSDLEFTGAIGHYATLVASYLMLGLPSR
jgi:hypothetical protein